MRKTNLQTLVISASLLGLCACANEVGPSEAADDLAFVAPEIDDNGDFRLAIDSEDHALVSVRSREFASMEELFAFAMNEMGGEPVYDESGALVGVHGFSVLSGDVEFRDAETLETFRADDLAQAYLGGADASIVVAGELMEIGARPSHDGDAVGVASAALSDDSVGCVGEDCISGHSWKTNYYVYRSVGSETRQSSGGYTTYQYDCCRGATLVTREGRHQCRYVTEWEPADPRNGQYRPIPLAYGYRAVDRCTGTGTRNSLTLGVTAVASSGFATAYAERTEVNTREVSMSEWGVGLRVSFAGIDDVAGVCGYHTGSRGSTTRTRAGSATDSICEPPRPVFSTRR